MNGSFRLGNGRATRAIVPALVFLTFAGSAGAGTARHAAAPKNNEPPTITGTPTVGQALTANAGSWNGTNPINFAYQWKQCDANGGACKNISKADKSTYTLASAQAGNTVRVEVTATNSDGTGSSTSVPTSVIAKESTTTTTTTPSPPPTGCPPGKNPVNVSQLSLPTRLLIDAFSSSPTVIGKSIQAFTLRVRIADTCGQVVGGALVYVTATPYNMFSIPPEAVSANDGWATLRMDRLSGFPVSPKQTVLALFIRARKDGEDLLAGISVRRLVSLTVDQSQ